ncbi:MAG: ribonuclease D [Alphaproteobacteria bacterium]|nr:ribonuclease D [Alphaproteobacteria bacterium]
MTNFVHKGDLPADVVFEGDLAVDTEAMGLINQRDRLCVVQISDGKGDAHLVQIDPETFAAPRLKALLEDTSRTKIFHFARFDVAILWFYLQAEVAPIYCTKIASKLCRTYTDRHGFRDLCRELLSQDISKQQQSSDWGADELTPEQINYAASDVLYLHGLRDKLNVMLEREGRTNLAKECFAFIPTRCALDLEGWPETDIFSH